MRPLTREEMRSVDAYAIETLGIPGLILMENAGRNTAGVITERLGGPAGKRVAIVAGAGNNGGDGFVIARHLANRGAAVTTFVIAPEDKIGGDAKTNYNAIRALEHDVQRVEEHETPKLVRLLDGADVVVDAAGGTGIRGELRGTLATAVEQINAADAPVVAVDIPTGLDCDTGSADGGCVKAECTVTMAAMKKGFRADGAEEFTGEVVVVDIGIPVEWVFERVD
jgi:NAD(P)H-hydrate epimerase